MHANLLHNKQMMLALLLWFASVNLLTYIFYAHDKCAAREGARRIPEGALLFLALLGGTPAAFFAGRRLRHKTRKLSYRLRLIAIALLQLAACCAALLAFYL